MSVDADPALHPGKLGTYSYNQFASDAPWLPARILDTVEARHGATLTVRFTDGTSIASWSVVYAAAADTAGDVRHGLTTSGEGEAEVLQLTFATPPAGDWVLAIGLGYPANLGAGFYYWHVKVAP